MFNELNLSLLFDVDYYYYLMNNLALITKGFHYTQHRNKQT